MMIIRDVITQKLRDCLYVQNVILYTKKHPNREEGIMDESKEYEQMCEASKEIQEIAHLTKLRFANMWDFNGVYYPSQARLQEIIDIELPFLVYRFRDFVADFMGRYTERFDSMEQLWLAFVMYEKFGKKWDGEEWKAI